MLESWNVGKLECWNVGKLECWKVGMLESWNIGMLESWKVGKFGSWDIRSNKIGKLEIGKVRSRKLESDCRFCFSPRKSASRKKAVLSPCKDRKR